MFVLLNLKKIIDHKKKMCLGLFTGSVDKLTAAGIILNGAAADDMEVDIYILLQAARVFKKDISNENVQLNMAENHELKDEFIDSLQNLKIPQWFNLIKQARELTDVRIHVCGVAGKIWNASELDEFDEIVDDIVGISEYIKAAQVADFHLFI